VCAVLSCDRPVKARHLCLRHYRLWTSQRRLPPHDGTAGDLSRTDDLAPLVCVCVVPQPDAIGACVACGRLVVTFAHACRERYRERYPVEWARAEALGFGRPGAS
jgi:hypothetical protein